MFCWSYDPPKKLVCYSQKCFFLQNSETADTTAYIAAVAVVMPKNGSNHTMSIGLRKINFLVFEVVSLLHSLQFLCKSGCHRKTKNQFLMVPQ